VVYYTPAAGTILFLLGIFKTGIVKQGKTLVEIPVACASFTENILTNIM
jgi:hypothetical protein